MADSPNRPNYGSLSNRSTASRRSRPSMRIPSARSSVAYDDYPSHLHPHALRSVSSRFSLGDFAATRSEFDFDDDASSIFERATLASDAGDVASDKFVAVGGLGLGPVGESGQTVNGDEDDDGEGGSSGDYYDLLCLPQDPSLTPHRIRQAYWRLLALLLNNDCPENLIPLATTYLVEAQQAFETLIDPARRVDYDDRLRTWLVRDDEFQTEDRKELYEDALADHLWLASQRQAFSSSAVNIRLDTCSVAPDSYQVVSRNVLLRPLDFALSHSVTTTLSSLGRSLKRLLVDERLVPHMRVTGALTELTATSDIYLPAPELTISGSAYGLFERETIPNLLPDQYQPLATRRASSHKLACLAQRAFLPGVDLDLRQDVLRRTADNGILKSSVQFRCALLERGLGGRISHEVPLWGQPLTLKMDMQSSGMVFGAPSQVGVGLSYPVSNGLAFIVADSGDWRSWAVTGAGAFLAEHSLANVGDFGVGLPLGASPTVEIGFATTSMRPPVAWECHDSQLSRGGIWGLENETEGLGDGSWSVRALLTPSTATGSVRYSRDVSSLDIMPSSTDSRLEVELASTLFFKRHLAVRNLWRVGVHAKLGLEIGISSHTFHLSLYWSRLKHRFSLPLLLSSPGTSASANVVFWAGVLPFLAMAGMQYLSATSLATKTKSSDMKTTEEIECRVARKCAEADNVAAFLAAPVEAKQQRQREKDGLVILDAKYGVKSMLADGTGSLWNAGQVADVTVATAALVDDHGRLVIPSGVKKSGVLGFWDPAPGSIKVLQVRYMYGGKEEMIDVKGRRALVLPPMKDDV